MNTRSFRACPICESNQVLPLFSNTMAALDGLDMSYHIVSCAACGFVFANQLPSPDSYAAYYHSLSKYDTASSSGGLSETDRLRSAAAVNLLRSHIALDASIADLGCGSGMLLGAFRMAGWSNLVGIDPAPGAPERARHQYGLDCVQRGTLEQAHKLLDLASFDLICLTGVLEHLPRLRQDLQALVSAVGPQTRILIEVPALERCTCKPFEPYGEFSLEHIQFFSTASLTRFFESLGCTALSLNLIDLPVGDFDSILGLFTPRSGFVTNYAQDQTNNHLDDYFNDYMNRSEAMVQAAMERIQNCSAKELLIYGAGSHTARLLPRLLAQGENRLVGLVDNNPNLQGKYLGPLRIDATETLDRYPYATIVISSFRAQREIAGNLRTSCQNPVLELY